jgi:hypothetical protein
MKRIALIVLAIAAYAGATITPVGAMHINLSAPRISGGIAGGSQAFTPRPFNRIPNVSIPLRSGDHSPDKHLQKPFGKDFCEALYQCCVRSWGHAGSCCDVYNSNRYCPY